MVVGLDLSLTATGAAIAGKAWFEVTTLGSKGRADASLMERHARLADLATAIFDTIPDGDNVHVAIETPAHNQTSGHHHDRSGLWWLVIDLIARWALAQEIRVHEVSTTQVKKYATGKGNASKAEVMIAAVKRYPQFDITNDNEADAVVLAAFLARALGHPIEDSLPQTHLAALDKFRPNPGTER